jgi:hypothetical protein
MADTISKAVNDKSNYEWVEVPEEDTFGKPHSGVSVNFEHYGPGRHFLEPLLAGTVRSLLLKRLRADQRVYIGGYNTGDKEAMKIMENQGLHR